MPERAGRARRVQALSGGPLRGRFCQRGPRVFIVYSDVVQGVRVVFANASRGTQRVFRHVSGCCQGFANSAPVRVKDIQRVP
eukprot:7927626-Lingulodinium_polyedra.AAC.1